MDTSLGWKYISNLWSFSFLVDIEFLSYEMNRQNDPIWELLLLHR